MFSRVNSHSNATSQRWHLWEIDLRFAHGLPPGWECLALSQTISSPQNEETRSQRFVKSRQIPLKKSTFGDLGSSIDLVNRIEAELERGRTSLTSRKRFMTCRRQSRRLREGYMVEGLGWRICSLPYTLHPTPYTIRPTPSTLFECTPLPPWQIKRRRTSLITRKRFTNGMSIFSTNFYQMLLYND